MSIDLDRFDGRFTPEIRLALKEKRKTLGFGVQAAARFCRVDASTYRKWELGPTSHCGIEKLDLLKKFLTYENIYDYVHFDMYTNSCRLSVNRHMPDGIYAALDQQFNFIHLLQNNRRFLPQYIQDLNRFNHIQMQKFIREQRPLS